MKPKSSSSAVAITLVVIAAVAALAAGIIGGRVEIEEIETHEFVPQDHPTSEGVVVTKTQRGGFELFGITLSEPGRYVRVAFTVPAACQTGDATQWPTGDPECVGPEGLTGTMAGGGITATGEPLVFVEVRVDLDCYEAIELGMLWPPPIAGCEPIPQ